ncbi:ABC transporter ATP-binding protein [Halonotius terrestris]|uniref:ABC transporter ATP-binding protein n=1 Tax=Halonotius terrestris TaxID=2487750 RepID=A0A8J8PDM3_9EURY|nr:ABC transporter ATP-binding protein [Halonotius terrestris]TQQ83375.1 ABC transporter ATP-binding protein [Halonotius terrestris]
MSGSPSFQRKFAAVWRVAMYRPLFTISIIFVSIVTALLEGIGLSFLLPIIRLAQGQIDPNAADGILSLFVTVYQSLGIPFTLDSVVVGVAAVMTVRYGSSFTVSWLRTILQMQYVVFLKETLFDRALNARISYFDTKGSDELLNAVVTQVNQAGNTIERIVAIVETAFLSLIYLAIALVIAPLLTVLAATSLGIITFLVRYVISSGYSLGSKVAAANERIHQAAQGGIQGIRDVKLFGLTEELYDQFATAVEESASVSVTLNRNEAAINNLYQLLTAITVFVLIYFALTIASLSIPQLGVFLFAMFRLAPRISALNNIVYQLDGELPHLVRTQQLIDNLEATQESGAGDCDPPATTHELRFEDVSFSYEGTETILESISFQVERGEFVAFVGPSGAGKSTIVSLLARLYEPDDGQIVVDDLPLTNIDIAAWREDVSLVCQQPHIFNDTLRRNVTVGDREATVEEIERVCDIAQVTEFLDELPNGYDTVLGDNGVRLSGGQRQRIAIARALLKDAEFLVLDEATSDLDSNIEKHVHNAIESMDRDYAVLVVAHRLSTITDADCIHTLQHGRIVESGSHSELIQSDGAYADLYSTQMEQRSRDA